MDILRAYEKVVKLVNKANV